MTPHPLVQAAAAAWTFCANSELQLHAQFADGFIQGFSPTDDLSRRELAAVRRHRGTLDLDVLSDQLESFIETPAGGWWSPQSQRAILHLGRALETMARLDPGVQIAAEHPLLLAAAFLPFHGLDSTLDPRRINIDQGLRPYDYTLNGDILRRLADEVSSQFRWEPPNPIQAKPRALWLMRLRDALDVAWIDWACQTPNGEIERWIGEANKALLGAMAGTRPSEGGDGIGFDGVSDITKPQALGIATLLIAAGGQPVLTNQAMTQMGINGKSMRSGDLSGLIEAWTTVVLEPEHASDRVRSALARTQLTIGMVDIASMLQALADQSVGDLEEALTLRLRHHHEVVERCDINPRVVVDEAATLIAVLARRVYMDIDISSPYLAVVPVERFFVGSAPPHR